MIWYDFGPIRTSGSIVSTLTLHSLTGTLKGPGSFVFLQRGLVGEIVKRFEQKGFKLVAIRLIATQSAFSSKSNRLG